MKKVTGILMIVFLLTGCSLMSKPMVQVPVGDAIVLEQQEVRMLSEAAQDAVYRALDDEYKAYATYQQVLDTHGQVKPFSNIIKAEETHYTALEAILRAYDLDIPENEYLGNIVLDGDIPALCAIGVQAEIDNAALYRDELLPAVTDYQEITQVFERLMRASEENHLRAFSRCTK